MRLEAAVEVMGTTTATRNNNKFKIPDDIRKMATEAAKCMNLIQEKHEKARRQFGVSADAMPHR